MGNLHESFEGTLVKDLGMHTALCFRLKPQSTISKNFLGRSCMHRLTDQIKDVRRLEFCYFRVITIYLGLSLVY